MKRTIACLCACLAALGSRVALAGPDAFSFAVIPRPLTVDAAEQGLREAIDEADADSLAFVVVNGIKAAGEPCSDMLYLRRKQLLDGAQNGLIVSLAASDWAECKNSSGKPAAQSRLSRLRELFFSDEFSTGASRIPLVRQSMTAKFSSFAENARWEIGSVMFATINLPDNNNHYRNEAGRNSEFEDRLVANRDWMYRAFSFASRKKMRALVLVCDGNPIAKPSRPGARRDGFAEMRQQIVTLASKFPGKVLLIHNRAAPGENGSAAIVWRGNLGTLEASRPWTRLTADPALPALFAVTGRPAATPRAAGD